MSYYWKQNEDQSVQDVLENGPMTSDRLPRHCPLQDGHKQHVWTQDRQHPPEEKIQGNLGAQRRIASFVRATGIPV